MTPRLLEKYRKEIIPKMMEKFSYKNRLEVPHIKKIIINMGIGEGVSDIKIIEKAMEELSQITGQKPIICRAKKAIANFKIRADQPVGCKITLRRFRMYEFLDRLINLTLPRIRDFSGVPSDSFDQGGNYSFGINDQSIFPEMDIDKIQRTQGMDIIIVINAKFKEESYELLKFFGMPFKT